MIDIFEFEVRGKRIVITGEEVSFQEFTLNFGVRHRTALRDGGTMKFPVPMS